MNSRLNQMLQMLNEQQTKEKKDFIRKKLNSHSGEIYTMTIDELLRRDFKSAIVGFTVLCALDNSKVYANALRLLKNKDSLTAVMKERGLSPDLSYYKEIVTALK